MALFDRLGITYRMVRYGLPLARLRPSSPYSVADRIEAQARTRGSRPFVLYEDRVVSYGEHNERANRLAHYALGAGLRPGDVVALLMLNRPEYLSTWGGLAKLGATTALLNTNLSGRGLAHAIEAAGTTRVIVGSECLESIATLDAEARSRLQILVLRDPDDPGTLPTGSHDVDLDRQLESQPTTDPRKEARADVRAGDPLVYIYTSGTTGLPKAARMSHLRFTATGAGAQVSGFGSQDVMYCALPLYHSAGGAMAVMAALNSGGAIAVRRRFSASQFWEDVHRFEATSFQYIGEFCRYLLNQQPHPLEKAHRLEFAIGNGLRPDIWAEFQSRFAIPRIVEFYGATEGNVALMNFDGTQGSVGKRPPAIVPAPKIIRYDVEADTHVRGDDGLCIECGPDEVGELVGEIPKNPDVASGRFEGYTSKEATDKKILHDVVKEGDAWFRTGDLLKCDARGYYYFIDRIGDTFRWKGENVSTQEVAEALSAYPATEMVNVYGVDVPGADGRAGMAAIVLENPDSFDGQAYYELVAESLPGYAAPVFVRLQRDLEVTGTFKLRKVDLQREGYDPAQVKDALYVRDDAARAYLPLTDERRRALEAGELRV